MGEKRARTLIVAGVILGFLWMIQSLLVPLLLAGVFGLLLRPVHEWLRARLGRAARLAPFITTAGALLLVIFPLAGVLTQAVASITAFASELDAKTWQSVSSTVIEEARDIANSLGVPTDRITETAVSVLRSSGTRIAGFLQSLLRSLPNAVLDLFVFILALYFLLRDGDKIGRSLLVLSPFDDSETTSLLDSMTTTVRGAILGTIVVAFVQGGFTIVAFLIFGIPGAFLFGVIAAGLSLIPMVGTLPTSAGAVLYLLIQGRYVSAVLMLILAVVVIGGSDNIIRPYVQSRAKLHPLMALVGILGGLTVIGPAGIFIGPVFAAVVVWMLQYILARREAARPDGVTHST